MTFEYLERLKRVEALSNAKDTQSLLNEASNILENPLIMFDTGYNLITSTENIVTDDLIWNELTLSGGFSAKMRELFKEEGFFDAVADAGVIAFLVSEKLKYDRMLGKIYNRSNVHVANLILVACNRPFETEDPVFFEAICKTVSARVCSSVFYLNYGKSYEEKLIKRLIRGNLADRELYSAQIAILYKGLKDNLFLAIFNAAKGSPEAAGLTRVTHLLPQMHPSFKFTVYYDYVVAIISSDSTVLNIKKDLSRLYRLCCQSNIYVGFSRRFDNLFELPKCYGEAVESLKHGLINDRKRRFFLRGED